MSGDFTESFDDGMRFYFPEILLDIKQWHFFELTAVLVVET
jgi:hypothetical protein